MMLLSKHPLVLYLLLITAASSATSAAKAFESYDELKDAASSYCAGTFNEESTYGNIENWDVSKITDMSWLFQEKNSCNPKIGSWDVSKVTDFYRMFDMALAFNQDISNWDVSSGTNFGRMFRSANAFNHDISNWDVSSGTDFGYMFLSTKSFNQDISNWDVRSGTNFYGMFYFAEAFNQGISNWDVSSGTNFGHMFRSAREFNHDISNWDVSSGTNFEFMFHNAEAFNHDISNWDVSSGTNFGYMFTNALAFNQPLIYCKWQSNNYFANASPNPCTGSVSCGWELTECPTPVFTTAPTTTAPTTAPSAIPTNVPTDTPTSAPTDTPTPAPTPASTFSPAKERSWDMDFFTNVTIANVADSLDAEISQSFNISNRAFDIKYYRNDCKSELVYSISEQNNVRSSDEWGSVGFLKLRTTAILNSTEVFYGRDRDDIFTGDNSGGYASLCTRANLYLSDEKDVSVNFLEKRVNITVDLETASLIVDEIDMKRTDAVENADVGLDYSNYVEAYECDPSNISDKGYTGIYRQGSVLSICVKSNNPEVIEIKTITNMLVEQDVVGEESGKKYQYIADGVYNREITDLSCNTKTSPKVCIGKLSLISMFFEEMIPPSMKVSGDVTLATKLSSGGESSRLLRGMELSLFESSASNEKNDTAHVRALEKDYETNDSEEIGSFRNVEVGGLVSSKLPSGTAATNKADKAVAFTMSSLAFDSVVVGGATLLLLV